MDVNSRILNGRHSKKFFLLTVFSVCFRAMAVTAVFAALPDDIADIIGQYESSGRGKVHFSVVKISSGRQILSGNARVPAVPASNQKILTVAFALSRLGEDYKFCTRLYRSGNDLVVLGGWDPTFGDPVLSSLAGRSIYDEMDSWAKTVIKKAGRQISGDLVVCRRLPVGSMHPPGWPRRHYGKWYGAPVSKLSFHDNCYDVIFVHKSGNIHPVVTPASRYIAMADKTRKGSRHLWNLSENEDGSEVIVSGTYRSTSKDPVSVPFKDPPLLFARVFADRLARAGVVITGGIKLIDEKKIRTEDLRPIAETATPLEKVLKRAMKRSLNIAAECLFLCAGDGTWSGSAEDMKRFLVDKYGLETGKLKISDGSGLSDKNRLTALGVVKILTGIRQSNGGDVFLKSLPRSGEAHTTLRKRMNSGEMKGRVAAKTGYISGVVTLSGYVLDEKGNPELAFSILVNDVRGVRAAKNLADRICRLCVEWLDDV